MNRRILKKKSKAAAEVLVRDHGYSLSSFSPSDGDETIDAPTNFPRRQHRRGFSEPLAGTVMYSYQSNYECNEWDSRPAHDELQLVEMYDSDFAWDQNDVPE